MCVLKLIFKKTKIELANWNYFRGGNDRGRPPSPQTSSAAARPAGGSQRIVVVPAPAQPAVPTS